MRRTLWAALAVASLILLPAGASAQAVAGFGGFTALPQARERGDPTLDYKALYVVQDGAKMKATGVNLGLDRAAKLANMLAADGVPAERRHIAVVVLHDATEAVLSDAAYSARHMGEKNPDAPVVAALIAGGVSVRICGQAMAAKGVKPEELAPGVQLDISALMTSANLQLRGYVLWLN